MRAPLYLAMSDTHFWGAFLVIALTAAFVLYAFAAGLARAAGKVRPRRGDGGRL